MTVPYAIVCYLRYLIVHKWYTFRAAWIMGVPWLGITHDLSKFTPGEFVPYLKHFYLDPSFDLTEAWLEHIHHNKHHWSHWLMVDEEQTFVLEMPLKYRREMIADWMGAATVQHRDVTIWYRKNYDRILLGDDTRRWVDCALGVYGQYA